MTSERACGVLAAVIAGRASRSTVHQARSGESDDQAQTTPAADRPVVELLRYHDAGWRLSEFNAFGGYFFAEKAYEDRRMVRIATEDPRTQVTRAGNR